MNEIYSASDYAGMEAGPFKFYYGYEYGKTEDGDELWGFRATRNNLPIYEYAQTADKYDFDCLMGLLVGIAKCFERDLVK